MRIGTRRIGRRLLHRQHLVHELVRSFALVFDCAGDAAAGVNQQATVKRQVRLVHQALDYLRTTIFSEREVAFLQRCHQSTMLVAHRYREQHLARLYMQRCHRLVIGCLLSVGLLGEACH